MMNTKAILSLPKPSIEDTSSSNDGSFDYNSTLNKVDNSNMLRTPSPEAYNNSSSALSRARSVPLKDVSKSSEDILEFTTATKSFDMTSTTRHYTVVATDCRRSMLSSGNNITQYQSKPQPLSDHRMLQSRRASGLSGSGGSSECQTVAAASSSFGSFGGNDADHEDNVEDEDEDTPLENLAEENATEGDDELDEEIDLRAKRQREALVCVRPEDESEFQKIKQHQKYTSHQNNFPETAAEVVSSNKRHHLTVKSANRAKCAKTYTSRAAGQSSSQQRTRQLQFLRYVHSKQKRLNDYINEADEDLSNALDSDEILNDSIGGLGQQIEKLSSNTLEFCDSIDERTSSKKPCTASHTHYSSEIKPLEHPYIEVTQPEAEAKNKDITQTTMESRTTAAASTMRTTTHSHSATSKPPSSASNIQHGTSNAFFRLGRFQSKQLNSNNSGNLQMSAPPKQSRYGSSILGGTFSNFASKFKKKDTIKNTMPAAEEFTRPTFIPETISSFETTSASVEECKTASNSGSVSRGRNRKAFKRQDTPRVEADIEKFCAASATSRHRHPILHSKSVNAPFVSAASASPRTNSITATTAFTTTTAKSMESKLTFDQSYITPPAISIECPADETPESLGYSRLIQSSPVRSPSTEDTTPRGFSSLDTDRDVDTPVLDEFAQFVNASIHPPNELSVPRSHLHNSLRNTLSTPSTAPSSRRPSNASRLSAPNHRNARSLSLGLYGGSSISGCAGSTTSNRGGSRIRNQSTTSSKSFSKSSGGSPISPPQWSHLRPQLRRESAQDLGDGEAEVDSKGGSTGSKKKPPPDLKIDLIRASSVSSVSTHSPYSNSSANNPPSKLGDNSFYLLGYCAPGSISDMRRHSHTNVPPTSSEQIHKSAPVTPLNRSTNNVNSLDDQSSKIPRSNSYSRDKSYLNVPSPNRHLRERGTSLPGPQTGNGKRSHTIDLYRLREFTVKNNRIISHTESLQPRYGRSSNSINSSASSLTFSHSGRSSLRSSTTEDDERETSRNSSVCAPRFTVLMLGAQEVGKTTLTSHFMTSCNNGAYGNTDSFEEEYAEKCVNVLLDGEEAELVFIDHPNTEISVENAVSTYMPDALVIVYSVVDNTSLKVAEDILQYLWRTQSGTDKAVILVGNKSDLVRTRAVPIVDAKTVASSFDCKYTETSGALNHNVDELLVGILKQIRLKQAEKARFSASGGRRKNRLAGNLSVPTGKSPRNLGVPRRKSAGLRVRGLLDKMLGVDPKSKSCDDLNVL